MQKLEKLIDLAAEALSLYVRKTTAELGEALPIKETPDSPAAVEAEKRTRVRKAKPEEARTAKSAFDPGVEQPAGKPAAPASKLSAEESLEAGRRGQEVMGLFIRRNLKASPTGLERAKKIINETLGLPRVPATAWKLEDFTPEDWLKLTPKFEAELDKAGAA